MNNGSRVLRIPKELCDQIEREMKEHNNMISKKMAMVRIANITKESKRVFRVPKFQTEIKLEKKDVRLF